MIKNGHYEKISGYIHLERVIGQQAINELLQRAIETYNFTDPAMIEKLLKHECNKLAKLANHFARDATFPSCPQDLAPRACISEAADWIYCASHPGNASPTDIAGILSAFIQSNAALTRIDTIVKLHQQIAPDLSVEVRGMMANSPLPSSISGRALFEWQLQRARGSENADDFPQRIYGWISGWHPFPDGNRRTARAAYAIAAIKNHVWFPLTPEQESQLSGLAE